MQYWARMFWLAVDTIKSFKNSLYKYLLKAVWKQLILCLPFLEDILGIITPTSSGRKSIMIIFLNLKYQINPQVLLDLSDSNFQLARDGEKSCKM